MKNLQKVQFLPLIFLVFAGTAFLQADDRKENIDLYLVVDKSSSMVEEIGAVKEYLQTDILDTLIIPGDHIKIIIFFGESHMVVDTVYNTKADLDSIRATVASLTADGLYTDIGNALDQLRNVSPYEPERTQYMLLVTDGIQEAPPESPYYSPDGSFNHRFMENAKTIQKKGWKIHILGIGAETAAKALAEELTGTYAIIPNTTDNGETESLSVETVRENAGEILGKVELALNPEIEAIEKNGDAQLNLTLRSTGYSQDIEIYLAGILLTLDERETQILPETFRFRMAPEEERTLEIPVSLGILPSGDYHGELFFRFDGRGTFIPAVTDVHFRIAGFWGRNLWLVPTALVFMVFAVFLIIYLIRIRQREREEDEPREG